jgi:hypothetical protein
MYHVGKINVAHGITMAVAVSNLKRILAVCGGPQGIHPHLSAPLLHQHYLLCHPLTIARIIYDKNDKILYFPSCTAANILHI